MQNIKKLTRRPFAPTVLASFLFALTNLFATSKCSAQESSIIDGFIWQKDQITGIEHAESLEESSIGFFDIGDLSYFSLYLVRQTLASLAAAAGKNIGTKVKRSTIAIFHDSKVFARLKNDRNSFTSLGIPDDTLDKMLQYVEDDAKCIYVTRSDDKSNIILTVILLSENFNECLLGGLISTFGINATDVSIRTLISSCILYEGRRQGLRDRQGLISQLSRLHDLCVSKAGEIK